MVEELITKIVIHKGKNAMQDGEKKPKGPKKTQKYMFKYIIQQINL